MTATAANFKSTRRIVFYDDARARTFEPFALSRPFCEMRVGALLVRERWEMALRATSVGFISAAHLTGFVEEGAPANVSGVVHAGTIVVNARAAIALSDDALVAVDGTESSASDRRAWFVGGQLAAVELQHDHEIERFRDASLTLEALAADDESSHADAAGVSQASVGSRFTNGRVDVGGVWINEIWDVVGTLSAMLSADIPALAATLNVHSLKQGHVGEGSPGPIVIGEHPLYVERGATLEPMSVFDTTLGPVLLRSGSSVQAFTRVVGPCYVGRNSTVMADRISGSAIGDTCRVHGELSATVFLGFSNKGHDGFVGHSIVGRWVNMGAGTITSNLKNTYGTVALWTPSGVRDTKLQFLGTLFGDHVKTGIGMRLTTGCVLGTAANVFDSMTPKVVEPFAWGSGAPYTTYAVDKFIETAARMMSRRHVDLDEDGKASLRAIHAARWRAS